MRTIRLVVSAIFALFGVFLFFFGGYDDSPGAQLLGVIVFIGSAVSAARSWQRSR